MTNLAKKELVHGIEASKLDEVAISAGLAACDIVPAEDTKLAGKVELLIEHFKSVARADLADCNYCGGASDIRLPACPFCGKGEDEPAQPPEDVGDPPDADEGGGNPGDDEDRDPGPAPSPEPTEAVETHPTTAQPLVDLKKERAKRGRPAKAKALPKQDAAGESVTAIVPKAAGLQGATQLDADVAEILMLKRGFGASSWLLAQKIAMVDESQRWKLRLDGKGKVKYRTFEEFVKAEAGIGREYASDLKKIFVRFTREEFETVGVSKLRLVIRAPESEQAEVLNKIKEKGGAATKREVAEEVATRRKKAGLKTSQGKDPKAKKPAEKGKITIAALLGKHTIRAYKKPEKRLEEGETTPRAKKIADRPYASLQLANDVTLWIEATVDGGGEIVFKLDVRRDEE
jgi:hypothetical protein